MKRTNRLACLFANPEPRGTLFSAAKAHSALVPSAIERLAPNASNTNAETPGLHCIAATAIGIFGQTSRAFASALPFPAGATITIPRKPPAAALRLASKF